MPGLALALLGFYVVFTLGLRMALHHRRTGSFGVHGISGRPGSAEWWGGVGFAASMLLAAAAPILDLAGALDPIPALDHDWLRTVAMVVGGVGLAGVMYSQGAMGESWRVGVDASERTQLVTGGPFRLVRNPIYSAMIPSMAAYAVIAGNACSVAAFVVFFLGLEFQVRFSEEPHMRRIHGDAYRQWAAHTGRFLPGIGRLG